jgi:hypothetical protein
VLAVDKEKREDIDFVEANDDDSSEEEDWGWREESNLHVEIF